MTKGVFDIHAKSLLSTPLDEIDKALAEKSLSEFLRQMWKYIDPHPYVHGWHIDAICEHMEAVLDGEILRLAINIPPRHMKSLGISVGFPAWAWIKKPSLQFLFSSYAATLSIRDCVKARRLIDSPLYKARWGEVFQLTSDQNTKTRYDNNHGGYRIATSVDGATTGEGGDVIIIDDANNVKEAESDVTRNNTNSWFDEVMQSRFNDPKTGALVSIQQRTHALDLSGHIQKKYGNEYIYLILPAEYEIEERRKMSLKTFHGWKDPRKKEGELLWPDRFGKEEVKKLKNALGAYAAAGQLQQRPAPREGGMVPMKHFQRYKTPPAREIIKKLSLSFDTASKEQELHDYSICEVWAETSLGYFLLYIWRKKVMFPELLRTAKSLCEQWSPNEVLIEDKSSGTSLIQCLRDPKDGIRFPVIAIEPGNFSKVIRMENESAAIESGMVWLPESAPWLIDFEDECQHFPNAEHDEHVDAMSQYLKRQREVKQRGYIDVTPDISFSVEQSPWKEVA